MSDNELDELPVSRRTAKRIIHEDDDDEEPIDTPSTTTNRQDTRIEDEIEDQAIDASEGLPRSETQTPEPQSSADINTRPSRSSRNTNSYSIDVSSNNDDYSSRYNNPMKKRRVIKKKHTGNSEGSSILRDLDRRGGNETKIEEVTAQEEVADIAEKDNDGKVEENNQSMEANKVLQQQQPQSQTPEEPIKPSSAPKLEKPAWMTDAMWEAQQKQIQLSESSDSTKEDRDAANQEIKKPKRSTNREEQQRRAEEFARQENERESRMIQRNIQYQNMKQDEIIRLHYNQQTHSSKRVKRTESKIYKLRSFNNCIKYMLIHKFGKQRGTALDLCCGKGGDMLKWESIQTASYVGIDISDESIREATKRYMNSRLEFHAVFITGDAFNSPIESVVEPFKNEIPPKFDTVSMQFCLHYAFENEKTIRNLLANVANSLSVGGMFIGTIPSSDYIKWKIERLPPGETKWGNSLYSVEFQNPPPRDGIFRPPYGQKYHYFLEGAVDVPEFVVPFEILRALCEEYNLELRYKKSFNGMFKSEIENYFNYLPRPLIEGLRRDDGKYGVTGDDQDACSFYLAFAFEKVGYE